MRIMDLAKLNILVQQTTPSRPYIVKTRPIWTTFVYTCFQIVMAITYGYEDYLFPVLTIVFLDF